MADYDSRLLLLSEDELKKLNFNQNPNEKKALEDDDPDILDTLDVNEEGFVIVPPERRAQAFSDDPDKYRFDSDRRYVDVGVSVDSTNITAINKNFKLIINKVFENDDIIKYNITIENDDDNCLVVDSVIQIAGTDLSFVDSQTKISEDEKILNNTRTVNGIVINKQIATNFIKKYRPDFDTLQSAIGNIPFQVELPDFLDQVDSRSLVLCPKNSNVETASNTKITERYNINTAELLPIQAAIVEESKNWAGFLELGLSNWPIYKVKKTGDNQIEEYSDTSLVDKMKKYTSHEKGLAWCASFAHTMVALAAEKIKHPILSDISSSKLGRGVIPSYEYAKRNGLLVPYLVPGCPAYGTDGKGKNHAILILEVRKITGNKPDYAFDCITIEGNTSTEKGVPTKYKGSSRVTGGRPGYGGRIFKKSGNSLYFGKFKFLGCMVPKDVQAKANGDYSIFISKTIQY